MQLKCMRGMHVVRRLIVSLVDRDAHTYHEASHARGKVILKVK